MDRKNSRDIDNLTFRALAAEARKRVPTKLVDVCVALSKATDCILEAGAPINHRIAHRMGVEIKGYLCG